MNERQTICTIAPTALAAQDIAESPAAEPFFSAEHHPDLAGYLSAHVEHDPATGCLLWTGALDKDGKGRAVHSRAARHGSGQTTRLAWLTQHAKHAQKGLVVTQACGCRRCINPDHLALADPEVARSDVGSIGELRVGRHKITAQTAWAIQNVTEGGCRPFRIETVFGLPRFAVEAIRSQAPRATRTVLESGFVRFDLPPGVTVVETDVPAEQLSDDPGRWIETTLWAARERIPLAA